MRQTGRRGNPQRAPGEPLQQLRQVSISRQFPPKHHKGRRTEHDRPLGIDGVKPCHRLPVVNAVCRENLGFEGDIHPAATITRVQAPIVADFPAAQGAAAVEEDRPFHRSVRALLGLRYAEGPANVPEEIVACLILGVGGVEGAGDVRVDVLAVASQTKTSPVGMAFIKRKRLVPASSTTALKASVSAASPPPCAPRSGSGPGAPRRPGYPEPGCGA